MSIRLRLAFGYGAGVIVTLLVVGLFVWLQMGAALRDSLEATLRTRATGVLTSLENAGQAGLQESDQAAPGVFAAIFSPDGSLIDASGSRPKGIRPVTGVQDIEGRHFLTRVVTAPDGSIVLSGADLQPIADAQAALARLLIGVGASVGAVSLIGGWLLAGRALRPVDRLIHDAATIGPDDLDRRLASPVRLDEVGRLTVTLNGMLDRIAESVDRQRLFVAMASHELRTPLAALRGELDIVDHDDATVAEYRAAVRLARGDAIRLSSLSVSLLQLAATREDAASILRRPIRLRELASTVIAGVEPLARRRGVVITLDMPDATVWVDRTRIEHALGNLLDNAVAYGGPGQVEVRGRVDGEPSDPSLTVEVLDRGPGLGDDSPDELFTPFRRGRGVSRAGSGLGLATVAGAVRAHGGAFGASDRGGGGARFWFTVPCGAAKSTGPDRAVAAAGSSAPDGLKEHGRLRP